MIELKALQGQVKNLTEDLRGQVAADTELRAQLKAEHTEAEAAGRSGLTFETWLDDVLDQAAVAWVLGCVFVRFCEDNRLVDPLWLGGPEDDRSTEHAMQARQAYIIANPRRNDRDWLREAFTHLRNLRATSKIFDEHNPVRRFAISGEAAEALSDFFRRGAGFRSLRSDDLDTRFLGDLYQDLSIHAQKTYALLQTPEFVEEFILDHTFTPALNEFGLAAMSVIDPTCGSGHFLLGAFHRLLNLWKDREPATPIDTLVDRALAQVTGVDINPFAVAIARFRLMIAALRATGRTNLNNTYPVRVAAGDSLLGWGHDSNFQGDMFAEQEGRPEFAYYSEDGDLLADYLRPGTYTVVVGNPPYITVKDETLSKRYRKAYPKVCYRQYALSVPFAQRFFELAKRGDHDGDGAGYVGQITANSFMKREFGKKLINDYLAHEVDLTEVIDTSGAYIPGHGTPTVILVGRNRLVSDRYSGLIRAVLGVRGEPSQPANPAQGLVWTSIVKQIDLPGSEPNWVSAIDLQRTQLDTHPWTLTGGVAVILFYKLSAGRAQLGESVSSIGYTGQTNADDIFLVDKSVLIRRRVDACWWRSFATGDDVRDYVVNPQSVALFPYKNAKLAELPPGSDIWRWFWPSKTVLWSRATFGKSTYRKEGRTWWEWHQVARSRLSGPVITWPVVQTTNHFVYLDQCLLHNRHAPVIKLQEGATGDDHLRLLGLLNSSTACFWLKQVSQNKGNGGIGGGIGDESWEPRYEFTSTKLEQFPLPAEYPLDLGRKLDGLARQLAAVTPSAVAASGVPNRESLKAARVEYDAVRARMIATQEELDWRVYRLYGLLEDDLTTTAPPELRLGERAFEIMLARRVKAGEAETVWFARHGSTPITELPEHWPADYRALVEKRIAMIGFDRNKIGLIERPEYKRRWATEGWDAMQTAALRDWLLDRLESPGLWGGNPTPLSVAQLADRVRHDEDFRSVLDLWVGTDEHDLVGPLRKLIADEHVPFLPADRYKPAGLRKRRQWERCWALQRREDAGESVTIEVPPKYTSADFAKASYWRNRGKLDVPKERFISYPRMGREGDRDNADLFGWAGWDHLAQARAIAGVYIDRKTKDGWPAERLLPLLAGLVELEPWLRQWFDESQAGFVGSPAEFFTGLIDTELSGLGADRHTLNRLRGVEELA